MTLMLEIRELNLILTIILAFAVTVVFYKGMQGPISNVFQPSSSVPSKESNKEKIYRYLCYFIYAIGAALSVYAIYILVNKYFPTNTIVSSKEFFKLIEIIKQVNGDISVANDCVSSLHSHYSIAKNIQIAFDTFNKILIDKSIIPIEVTNTNVFEIIRHSINKCGLATNQEDFEKFIGILKRYIEFVEQGKFTDFNEKMMHKLVEIIKEIIKNKNEYFELTKNVK